MRLERIDKPGRYVGGEVGAVIKRDADVRLHVALAFPDVYEIGMSHVGLKILYGLINRHPDFWAERVMAPWTDMEAGMREAGQVLESLESGRALSNFDVVGFSLQYELTYTNVLTMLELGGIPVRASDRNESHPLVIGGGPNAYNPEPVADAFDFFFLGDAEAGLTDVLSDVAEWKASGEPKSVLLHKLAGRIGVYVPSFFEPVYGPDGRVAEIRRLKTGYEKAERAVSPDMDGVYYPDCPVVPFTKPIHDRVAVEIARGCTRGCRFCQAGFIYRPVRERRPETVLDLADKSLVATGHDEASFLSLSAGDYSRLHDVMETFMDTHGRDFVSLSLPSLRVKSLNREMMHQIKRVRKTGFTLAPEAGTQRLRDVINKDLGEDDLMNAAHGAFELGWQLIKLYFMIGLPTETEEDVAAIADLARRVRSGTRGKINVSFAVFVPKVFTPFQWEAMLDWDQMQSRMDLLRGLLKKPGLNPKWNQPESSLIEGILSRGDRRLFPVIQKVQAKGSRFEAWSEKLDFDLWLRVMEEEGLTPDEYLRRRDRSEVLPWSHIDPGVSEDYLWSEREKAYQAVTTPDCRDGDCQACGVCDFIEVEPRLAGDDPFSSPEIKEPEEPEYTKIRLNYSKTGRAAMLSHLETADVFKRAFRRAGLRFKMSKGFHPQPKLTFAMPLSVGISGMDEYMEADLADAPPLEDVQKRLVETMPDGFAVFGVCNVPAGAPKWKIKGARYRLELDEAFVDKSILEESLAMESVRVTKKSKKGFRDVNLIPLLRDVSCLTEKTMELTLLYGPEGTVRPAAALAALLRVDSESLPGLRLTKIKTYFLKDDPCPPN